MKNKVLLICAGLLLFVFLVFGTYAWYLFFLKSSSNLVDTTNNSLVSGNIILKDNGNGVYDSDAEKVEDSLINGVIPYRFQVINNGIKDGKYTLYIEDLPVNSINDGCTEETLLTRSQLKYQLKLNGNVIKEDYLSNINDNILYNQELKSKKNNNYELRIYIHNEAEDWNGKHYHYKVVLNKSN